MFSGGLVILSIAHGPEEVLSANYACPDCGISLTEITPQLFSFNSPYGACPKCSGLGTILKADPERLVVTPRSPSGDARGGRGRKGIQPNGFILMSADGALSEGCTMSAKKDLLTSIGGFLALREVRRWSS